MDTQLARSATALLTVSCAPLAAMMILSSVVAAQTSVPGRTVRDGVYTTAQAERGKQQYLTSCSTCHLADLRGDAMSPSLVGNDFMLQWAELSANDLFVRARNSMPQDNPRSLADTAYVDILAFIFQANKFPAGDQELKVDGEILKAITITKEKK